MIGQDFFLNKCREVKHHIGTSSARPSSLVWRNVLMILEFPHFGFGVPRFPWAGEMVEVEGGGQGGGTGGTGRPSCL